MRDRYAAVATIDSDRICVLRFNAGLGMNRQHVARANRTHIQANPEGGVRH